MVSTKVSSTEIGSLLSVVCSGLCDNFDLYVLFIWRYYSFKEGEVIVVRKNTRDLSRQMWSNATYCHNENNVICIRLCLGGGPRVVVTQQTQNICIKFVQCWTNVEDVGPTLYKCYTNVLCLLGSTAAFHARVRGSVPGLGGFKEKKNVSSPSTCKTQYCGEPPWPRGSVLDLRPPGLEFRILCLEDSGISFISPSSEGSPGPV